MAFSGVLDLSVHWDAITNRGSDLESKVEATFVSLRQPVYRYLFVVFGNPELAEDITQEAFLRLQVHLQTNKAVDNVGCWIFRVAHNLALDRQKGDKFIQRMDSPEWDALVQNRRDSSPNPEQALLQRERFESVHIAMERLTSQERQALNLRAEGLRYREIAEILGVGTTTVADCLRRSVEKLKAEIHA